MSEELCWFRATYPAALIPYQIYEDIMKHEIDEELRKLLEYGYKVILQSDCYEEYGNPSYIR